jgi:N-acetyl-beta-hexosaminidase
VNGQISLSLDTSIAPGRFGLDKLKASLQRLGLTPQVVNSIRSSGQENILVQLIPASSDAEIKAEGFRIKNVESQIKVTAIDPAGIMYGLLELSE